MVESQPPKKPQSSSLQGSQTRSAGLNCAATKAEGRVAIFKTEKNKCCSPLWTLQFHYCLDEASQKFGVIAQLFPVCLKQSANMSSPSPFIHAKGEV